ncbi:MAG: hypothetical protein K5898_04745 [Ruminococcus sp.]|uniref:hypothetical protein n=1 Tax=Ruminococcus sp. TaxID=41978 RepID=UPI0025D95D35|nr:hypothetical protein [Ruminococcus sp.]MCR4794465.1 hypothetical protein [Ruminococcus sp.]
MINYIIFGVLVAVCLVSIIVVVTESVVPRNTGAGRILRAVRIRLREKSVTSFCVTAGVILIFALAAGDDEMRTILAALAVMLLTLIVLHPEDFISMFRHRKKARKKVRLGFTPILAGEVPEAKLAKVMEPVDTEIDSEEGKE